MKQIRTFFSTTPLSIDSSCNSNQQCDIDVTLHIIPYVDINSYRYIQYNAAHAVFVFYRWL